MNQKALTEEAERLRGSANATWGEINQLIAGLQTCLAESAAENQALNQELLAMKIANRHLAHDLHYAKKSKQNAEENQKYATFYRHVCARYGIDPQQGILSVFIDDLQKKLQKAETENVSKLTANKEKEYQAEIATLTKHAREAYIKGRRSMFSHVMTQLAELDESPEAQTADAAKGVRKERLDPHARIPIDFKISPFIDFSFFRREL